MRKDKDINRKKDNIIISKTKMHCNKNSINDLENNALDFMDVDENIDINELIYTSMYATIFGESLKAHDNILKNYPNITKDVQKNKFLLNMKKENPAMTKKETIAHAYTIALMTYVMFGLC